LYLPLIIFWNAATGQPQVSADFAFAMARSPVGSPSPQDTSDRKKVHSIIFVHTCVIAPGGARLGLTGDTP
jgi:hypothetical protein